MSDEVQAPLLTFRQFLFLVWVHLRLPPPTKRQYAIARFLQYGPARKMVMAFRGVGKSWITSAYVCWRLYCDPQVKLLVVSASKERADNFTTFCLRLINEMDILKHLRPRPDQRCSKVAFDVALAGNDHAPSLKSAGITGQITGSRADEIVADDVEVMNNSATQAMREKLSETVKDFDSILKPGGKITFLGTPQTEASIYNQLPSRGFVIKIWPGRFPTAEQRLNYSDKLADDITSELDANPRLAGTSTEPGRFSDEDLMLREMSIGRSTFALQFMLDTRLSDEDRYPLRLTDFIAFPLNPDVGPDKLVWAGSPEYILDDVPVVGMGKDRWYQPAPVKELTFSDYSGSVMTIDPSGRGKDETAFAVVNMLHSQLFLMDAGGFNEGYTEKVLIRLANIAKQWGVKKIIVESNFGDGMFTQLLKPVLNSIYPVAVEEIRHNTQKEKRIIDTLEPVMNSHRLIVNQKLIEKDFHSTDGYPTDNDQHLRYQLFYQLTRITRDRGSLMVDDRLDALAMAVGYWVNIMGADREKQISATKQKALDNELKRFMRHQVNFSPRRSWSSRPL